MDKETVHLTQPHSCRLLEDFGQINYKGSRKRFAPFAQRSQTPCRCKSKTQAGKQQLTLTKWIIPEYKI